jgi:hypothetical protein
LKNLAISSFRRHPEGPAFSPAGRGISHKHPAVWVNCTITGNDA